MQAPWVVSHVTVPIGGVGQSAVVVQVGTQPLLIRMGKVAHMQPLDPIGQAILQSASSMQPGGPIIPSAGGEFPSAGGGIPSIGPVIPKSALQAVGPVCVQASARSGCSIAWPKQLVEATVSQPSQSPSAKCERSRKPRFMLSLSLPAFDA